MRTYTSIFYSTMNYNRKQYGVEKQYRVLLALEAWVAVRIVIFDTNLSRLEPHKVMSARAVWERLIKFVLQPGFFLLVIQLEQLIIKVGI